MTPYCKKGPLSDEERVFNYRLSRFRRCSENAFGIWAKRFQLFANRAALRPGKIEIVVMASLVIHNMLRSISKTSYTPIELLDREDADGNLVEGSWRNESTHPNITSLQPNPPCRVKVSAEQARDRFKEYFAGPGQLPWQYHIFE